MSTDEQRIREFAYQIWESEGRPVGQEERHWAMACKLAEAEAAGELLAKPARPKRISKPKAVTFAEAESQPEQAALLKKPRAPRGSSKTPKV